MTRVPSIEVRALEKSFAGRRRGRLLLMPWKRPEPTVALRGVDLEIHPGELVTVVGPNGAGKTTLLKILAGLILPNRGVVRVVGGDAARGDAGARARTGYVLAEERSFYWRLSVRDNLRFFGALQGLIGSRLHARVEELARLFGLADHLDRDFQDLSAGQRQRAAIARALLHDPPVLLFDEATRTLDPGHAARVRRIIRQMLVDRGQKAVLFATHDMDEARELSDRCILMKEGRVAAIGRYADIEGDVRRAFSAESQDDEVELTRLLEQRAQ